MRGKNYYKKEFAFTLIELAIVLVIIGLFLSGVLAGKELIEQSKIKRQISQIREFSLAVNAFKLKYNALPGDIVKQRSIAFGFTTSSTSGVQDGDGIIEDQPGSQPPTRMNGEIYYAFIHLSQANLIKGQYIFNSGIYSIGDQFPPADIGTGGFVMLSYQSKVNLLSISNSNLTTYHYISDHSSSGIFTPQQAYQIDKKTDDGQPNDGTVRDVNTDFSNDTATGGCIISSSNITYNLILNDVTLCRLLIQI